MLPFLFDATKDDFLYPTPTGNIVLPWCLVVPEDKAVAATNYLQEVGCLVSRGGMWDPLTECDEYERGVVALYFDKIPPSGRPKYPPLTYREGKRKLQELPVLREYDETAHRASIRTMDLLLTPQDKERTNT